MAIKEIVTKTKLDALANSIALKSGVSAPFTIDEMKTVVDNMSIGGDFITQSKIISPQLTDQTITPDQGYDGLSDVTIRAMPSGSAGVPVASKGSVSNHTVDITPTVTNTTGYISGGTKTGTPVTVSASELVSGTKNINSNNTYDVSNYASVNVNVSASLVQRDVANTTGTTREITGDVTTIVPLNVTENGTYNAPTGVTGYNPVKVSVSGVSASQKAVNFIDYDGTIVESYTVEEAQALTALPNNPSHTGLVSQGWNWSLANIKSYLTKYPDAIVNVGQMYKTASGKTEIDVTFSDSEYLSPYLTISPNGTCTIDWGDGSETETISGASYTNLKYLPHTYTRTGNYTITIDGNVGFYTGSSSYGSLLSYSDSSSNKRIYSQCVNAIRLSETSKLGFGAFCQCVSLSSITIPNGITVIETNAFYNCNALESITIPDGVTTINSTAFYQCYAIRSISVPNTAISFGNSVFSSCYALQSITIPDGVTSIRTSVFQYCYALQSVTIPDGVTSIGNQAFQSCYAISSIIIPSMVTTVGNQAFQDCCNLKSVTMSNKVTSINSSTFSGCSRLTSFSIPDSVTEIKTNAFYGCCSLNSIILHDGVITIGSSAFYNCYTLKNITIPNSVTSIGNSAFYNCYALTSIIIPDGVTTIENNTFMNCSALKQVKIPNGITNIGISVFYGCSVLTLIDMPDSVISIGNSTFTNCYSILKYHFTSTTPPTLGTNVFTNIATDSVIYVPQGSLEAYQTAENWSTYASYMREEEL